ncbi:calreticulin 1b [Artemisia annua]|uniref:Calreticulin 1b n=1 Tax=Artemisia annua TaxID=35608 RepID=A0A2U1KXD5_ARTAN|nr:calreticulin 1b [Artemisia annua]
MAWLHWFLLFLELLIFLKLGYKTPSQIRTIVDGLGVLLLDKKQRFIIYMLYIRSNCRLYTPVQYVGIQQVVFKSLHSPLQPSSLLEGVSLFGYRSAKSHMKLIVKTWVKRVSRARGLNEHLLQEANAKIFTFRSYRLGKSVQNRKNEKDDTLIEDTPSIRSGHSAKIWILTAYTESFAVVKVRPRGAKLRLFDVYHHMIYMIFEPNQKIGGIMMDYVLKYIHLGVGFVALRCSYVTFSLSLATTKPKIVVARQLKGKWIKEFEITGHVISAGVRVDGGQLNVQPSVAIIDSSVGLASVVNNGLKVFNHSYQMNKIVLTGNIMFGPDIYGYATKKVHAILTHNWENKLIKKYVPCESDQLSHVYTFIIRPDATFSILIDNVKKQTASLYSDWHLLPAKQIKDPKAKKPEDCDDKEFIADPEEKKPEDYDDIKKKILALDAKKILYILVGLAWLRLQFCAQGDPFTVQHIDNLHSHIKILGDATVLDGSDEFPRYVGVNRYKKANESSNDI